MIKYMYGKCGVKCNTCPAYVGNINGYKDQEKCSESWKKYLNISLIPKYCKCNGCQAKEPWKDGNVIPDRSCLVRKCVSHSDFKTCGECEVYPCEHVKKVKGYKYTREWVENRIGSKMSDEDYKIYVETYDIDIHMEDIKKEVGIKSLREIKPIKVKMVKKIDADKNALYKFLYSLQSCKDAKSYIEQVLTERRIKPALTILWVFGTKGRLSEGNKRIEIRKDSCSDYAPFNNIIRKKDNYWHGSVSQVATLLKYHSLDMKFERLGKDDWEISLAYIDNENNNEGILLDLINISNSLINLYGEPEYVKAWTFKGEAFKRFCIGDF